VSDIASMIALSPEREIRKNAKMYELLAPRKLAELPEFRAKEQVAS